MYLDIIKFLNADEKIEAKLKILNKNLVEFTFYNNKLTNDIILSGFEVLNEHDFRNQSGEDYYGFTTLYRKIDENTFILSNDESVYIEPEVIIPYIKEPTEKELQEIFESNRINKIEESKNLLAKYLESHPLISNCHNNIEAQYSVTAEKQSLMANNYLTYTIAKQSGLDATLTWNATGQECEIWTEEEFVTLVLQISEYVKPLVMLQQGYEVQIRNCETQEELDAIEIVYNACEVTKE